MIILITTSLSPRFANNTDIVKLNDQINQLYKQIDQYSLRLQRNSNEIQNLEAEIDALGPKKRKLNQYEKAKEKLQKKKIHQIQDQLQNTSYILNSYSKILSFFTSSDHPSAPSSRCISAINSTFTSAMPSNYPSGFNSNANSAFVSPRIVQFPPSTKNAYLPPLPLDLSDAPPNSNANSNNISTINSSHLTSRNSNDQNIEQNDIQNEAVHDEEMKLGHPRAHTSLKKNDKSRPVKMTPRLVRNKGNDENAQVSNPLKPKKAKKRGTSRAAGPLPPIAVLPMSRSVSPDGKNVNSPVEQKLHYLEEVRSLLESKFHSLKPNDISIYINNLTKENVLLKSEIDKVLSQNEELSSLLESTSNEHETLAYQYMDLNSKAKLISKYQEDLTAIRWKRKNSQKSDQNLNNDSKNNDSTDKNKNNEENNSNSHDDKNNKENEDQNKDKNNNQNEDQNKDKNEIDDDASKEYQLISIILKIAQRFKVSNHDKESPEKYLSLLKTLHPLLVENYKENDHSKVSFRSSQIIPPALFSQALNNAQNKAQSNLDLNQTDKFGDSFDQNLIPTLSLNHLSDFTPGTRSSRRALLSMGSTSTKELMDLNDNVDSEMETLSSAIGHILVERYTSAFFQHKSKLEVIKDEEEMLNSDTLIHDFTKKSKISSNDFQIKSDTNLLSNTQDSIFDVSLDDYTPEQLFNELFEEYSSVSLKLYLSVLTNYEINLLEPHFLPFIPTRDKYMAKIKPIFENNYNFFLKLFQNYLVKNENAAIWFLRDLILNTSANQHSSELFMIIKAKFSELQNLIPTFMLAEQAIPLAAYASCFKAMFDSDNSSKSSIIFAINDNFQKVIPLFAKKIEKPSSIGCLISIFDFASVIPSLFYQQIILKKATSIFHYFIHSNLSYPTCIETVCRFFSAARPYLNQESLMWHTAIIFHYINSTICCSPISPHRLNAFLSAMTSIVTNRHNYTSEQLLNFRFLEFLMSNFDLEACIAQPESPKSKEANEIKIESINTGKEDSFSDLSDEHEEEFSDLSDDENTERSHKTTAESSKDNENNLNSDQLEIKSNNADSTGLSNDLSNEISNEQSNAILTEDTTNEISSEIVNEGTNNEKGEEETIQPKKVPLLQLTKLNLGSTIPRPILQPLPLNPGSHNAPIIKNDNAHSKDQQNPLIRVNQSQKITPTRVSYLDLPQLSLKSDLPTLNLENPKLQLHFQPTPQSNLRVSISISFNQYSESRSKYPIYLTKDIHVSFIQLLFSTLIDHSLHRFDVLFVDPFPNVNRKPNVLYIVMRHLENPSNSSVVTPLVNAFTLIPKERDSKVSLPQIPLQLFSRAPKSNFNGPPSSDYIPTLTADNMKKVPALPLSTISENSNHLKSNNQTIPIIQPKNSPNVNSSNNSNNSSNTNHNNSVSLHNPLPSLPLSNLPKMPSLSPEIIINQNNMTNIPLLPNIGNMSENDKNDSLPPLALGELKRANETRSVLSVSLSNFSTIPNFISSQIDDRLNDPDIDVDTSYNGNSRKSAPDRLAGEFLDYKRLLRLLVPSLFDPQKYSNGKHVASGAFGAVMVVSSSIHPTGVFSRHPEKNTNDSFDEIMEIIGNQKDKDQSKENKNQTLKQAVKVLAKARNEFDLPHLVEVYTEVSILEICKDDRRVTQLLDYGCTMESYYIVMEYYPTTLKSWRKKLGKSAKELTKEQNLTILRLYKEFLNSATVLTEKKINHFDIKCDNVMLDYGGHPALADFGESMCYTGEKNSYSLLNKGTEWIKSPEMLSIALNSAVCNPNYDRRRNVGAGPPSDIWSIGCLFYELLTGEFLFVDSDWSRFFLRITNNKENLINQESKERLPEDPRYERFLEFVLQRSARRRPDLHQVISKYDEMFPEAIQGNLPNIV